MKPPKGHDVLITGNTINATFWLTKDTHSQAQRLVGQFVVWVGRDAVYYGGSSHFTEEETRACGS